MKTSKSYLGGESVYKEKERERRPWKKRNVKVSKEKKSGTIKSN